MEPSSSVVEPNLLVEIAVEAARAAGALLLERFGFDATGVSSKSTPTDPVSDADRDSEALIAELLRARRPRDGIVTEEGVGNRQGSALTWVVDPLDGTVNFLFGIPSWSVSIAAEDDQGAVAGAVFDPNRDEMFSASRGGGSRLNGVPIRVSARSDLSQALVGTGFSYDSRAAPRRLQWSPICFPRFVTYDEWVLRRSIWLQLPAAVSMLSTRPPWSGGTKLQGCCSSGRPAGWCRSFLPRWISRLVWSRAARSCTRN